MQSETVKISRASHADHSREWAASYRRYGEDVTNLYRTNSRGEGLWQLLPSGGWNPHTGEAVLEWRQVLGTSHFHGSRREIVRFVCTRDMGWDDYRYDADVGAWVEVVRW